MSITVLLKKLIEVEQSVGVDTEAVLRMKIQEAQDYALQIQKETVESLLQRSGGSVSIYSPRQDI
jgi:hypothetical protein